MLVSKLESWLILFFDMYVLLVLSEKELLGVKGFIK